MHTEEEPSRLSQVSTLWPLVEQAHASTDAALTARAQLIERYGSCVRRYLLGALRDADAIDDLFQEFCLRLLRGDLRGACPERGRFRDLVKTTLYHLIVDHQRRDRLRPLALVGDLPERGGDVAGEDNLLDLWRDTLLERTWDELRELEVRTGQPCHTVLRFRFDHPLLSSAELAEQLGRQLGKSLTVHGVRQALHRARDRFADLLLAEVARSLDTPTSHDLASELAELGLLRYCLAALERRGWLAA